MSETAALTGKVRACHLARDAYLYVRQSSLTQVRQHTESLERQYELAERAVALGWSAEQVVTVDADLGHSGARTDGRSGFAELVAAVGLGKVGLILGIEVSRLARNNTDWYQLLDLAALTDTLIADTDGIYHPGEFNDRLVLGLKGTMSEAELHLIRGRLTAGLWHKAAKGELRQGLPVGFDYDETGAVVQSPDEAVGEAIATVFRRFDELGSARQVMLSLRGEGLLLPRRRAGSTRIRWEAATYPAVHDIVSNPTYAGAFVFGRTRTERRAGPDGRPVTRTRDLPREQWAVCIPDHHPGFISWAQYETNTALLRANWRAPRGQGGGPAREGGALLTGRVRCGRCSRLMQVSYSGPNGDSPRYACVRAQILYGNDGRCQSLGGKRLEARVLDEVFAVLSPAAMTATLAALSEAESAYRARLAAFELAVERARFEAERARRQFDAVEPENRLVARTLEREWETRLGEQRRAETELAAQRVHRPATLSEEELAWVRHAGADVRAVFEAATTTSRDRKQLIRALITEVVVTVDTDTRTAAARIVWQGGAVTDVEVGLNRVGANPRDTGEDTVQLVRRLAEKYTDTTIATILARQGRRTGTGLPFTRARVAGLRATHRIPVFVPSAETVGAHGQDTVVVTAGEAARLLGVSPFTVYRWLREGFLTGEQLTPGAPWRIRVDEQLRRRVVPDVPDGWLPLDQAAQTLGVARQTVLHKVQRGELDAVQVTRGRRKGLRINVIRDQVGLFDNP